MKVAIKTRARSEVLIRELPVTGTPTGSRVKGVRLGGKDLQELYNLPPEALHEWVGHMLTRFGAADLD